MKRFLISIVILAVLGSCGRDDKVTVAPEIDSYRGTYTVRDLTLVIDAQEKDSVLMTLSGNQGFAMFFWDVNGADFCNCEGLIYGLLTNRVEFITTDTIVDNCDAIRIPSGVFEATYSPNSDTIYMQRKVGDSLFQLELH